VPHVDPSPAKQRRVFAALALVSGALTGWMLLTGEAPGGRRSSIITAETHPLAFWLALGLSAITTLVFAALATGRLAWRHSPADSAAYQRRAGRGWWPAALCAVVGLTFLWEGRRGNEIEVLMMQGLAVALFGIALVLNPLTAPPLAWGLRIAGGVVALGAVVWIVTGYEVPPPPAPGFEITLSGD